MVAIDATIEYPINNTISLALNYIDVQYKETQGTTTRTYYADSPDKYSDGTNVTKGTVFVWPSAAGISNSYSTLNLVLVAKF